MKYENLPITYERLPIDQKLDVAERLKDLKKIAPVVNLFMDLVQIMHPDPVIRWQRLEFLAFVKSLYDETGIDFTKIREKFPLYKRL